MLSTLETWSQRVWTERDETAIDEMVVDGTQTHGLASQTLTGPEGFKSFHRAICALLTDTRLVVDHSIEADGWLAALCTFSGTASNGDRISITGSIHARIADGKIYEGYNHFDFVGMFTQLGLLPAETLQNCIAGRPACGE